MSTSTSCCCCQASLHPGLADWHFICPACGYESSTLAPSVNNTQIHTNVDEASRKAGLLILRQDNFQRILTLIGRLRPGQHQEALLDVGAAHGWFVEMARQQFASVTGIEPDVVVAAGAAERGISLRSGYFPQALSDDERFDVIVFNDVFEHIPDASGTLGAIRSHLKPGGSLALNLPTNTGFFYGLSKILKRIGLAGPFERMWQKGMPSPHVHYFSSPTLQKLLARHGFQKCAEITLPPLKIKGLHARIALSRQHNPLTTWAICACVIMIYPLLALLPQDTQVFVFTNTQMDQHS